MKTIQYPIPQYVPEANTNQQQTTRIFRGVNTFDPLSIDDSFFTDMSNMTTDDFPTATVRPGYTQLGSAVGSGKVLGLGVYKDIQLHAVFSDGTWRYWNGSAWLIILSGLSTTAEASFTNFKGNQPDICLFMANGVNGLKKWDGINAVAFGDAPSDINYLVTYSNRLWGISDGKEIHASSLNQPDQWQQFDIETYGDAASYAKTLETTRGEDINMLTGSLTKLTIGTYNSTWEMYGNLPSDFNFHLVTDDEGFSNNKSEITQEGNMYFIDRVGIFQYAGASLPSRTFSDIMRRYFGTIDTNTVAGSDGRHLYFRVDTDTILMFDTREDVQAWNVWRDIQSTQYTVMQKQLYIGDAIGRVLRLDNTTDNGTPISWSVTTKPFAGGSLYQKLRWTKIFIVADLAAGTTLNLSLSKSIDGNDFTQVKTITGTGTVEQRILVPIRGFELSNFLRIKIDGTGWAKIREITREYSVLPAY